MAKETIKDIIERRSIRKYKAEQIKDEELDMILQAGIGVAMGNAIDALKQQADYITTSVDEDGILNALRHFRVI